MCISFQRCGVHSNQLPDAFELPYPFNQITEKLLISVSSDSVNEVRKTVVARRILKTAFFQPEGISLEKPLQ
jgi:hypothetical protein